MRRQLWLTLKWQLLGAVALLGMCASAAATDNVDFGIAVIVARDATPSKLTREELAQIFKARKRFWDDGSRIQAVNLPASHPLRRAFSTQILGGSPEDLDDYWRDMYFHGVLPPYVLASQEAVLRFVSSTPGAIAYVSSCAIDRRVKVILQLEGSTSCPH